MLYYSHHRDVFAICVMFLVLAASYSAGVVGAACAAFCPGRSCSRSRRFLFALVDEMMMLWLFPKTARLLGASLGPYGTMASASVIAIVMSFGAATILYLLVEQPSMRARSLPIIRRLTGHKVEVAPA